MGLSAEDVAISPQMALRTNPPSLPAGDRAATSVLRDRWWWAPLAVLFKAGVRLRLEALRAEIEAMDHVVAGLFAEAHEVRVARAISAVSRCWRGSSRLSASGCTALLPATFG